MGAPANGPQNLRGRKVTAFPAEASRMLWVVPRAPYLVRREFFNRDGALGVQWVPASVEPMD